MGRFINPLYVNNLVDSNILDNVADGQDKAISEIVRMVETGEVTILLPHSVRAELNNPDTPANVRRAAAVFPFSLPVSLNGNELRQREVFVATAKGNAQEKNIVPDLLHVWDAAKYGGYFITRDKRLLARSAEIARHLQIDVVTPVTFVERVAEARRLAASTA